MQKSLFLFALLHFFCPFRVFFSIYWNNPFEIKVVVHGFSVLIVGVVPIKVIFISFDVFPLSSIYERDWGLLFSDFCIFNTHLISFFILFRILNFLGLSGRWKEVQENQSKKENRFTLHFFLILIPIFYKNQTLNQTLKTESLF